MFLFCFRQWGGWSCRYGGGRRTSAQGGGGRGQKKGTLIDSTCSTIRVVQGEAKGQGNDSRVTGGRPGKYMITLSYGASYMLMLPGYELN